MSLPSPSATREGCGSCSLCCNLLAVPELDKQENCWCWHVNFGHDGCSIYRDRPTGCKNFSCEWLKSHQNLDRVPWPMELRPDNSHVVFAVAKVNTGDGVVECIGVHEDPAFDEPSKQFPVSNLIEYMRNNGIIVVIKETHT